MSEETSPQEAPDPTHPDFETLQQVIANGIDAAITEGNFNFETYAAQFVDPSSAANIAIRRVIGMGLFPFDDPLEFTQKHRDIMRAAMLYVEAMVIGIQFEQHQNPSEDRILAGVMRKMLAASDAGYTIEGDRARIDGWFDLSAVERAVLDELFRGKER